MKRSCSPETRLRRFIVKKKMLEKIKSVKFWLSLSGAIVIVLQLFGLRVSAPFVNEVVSAICSVFVILGIMVPDNGADGENETVGENEIATEDDGEKAEKSENKNI